MMGCFEYIYSLFIVFMFVWGQQYGIDRWIVIVKCYYYYYCCNDYCVWF